MDLLFPGEARYEQTPVQPLASPLPRTPDPLPTLQGARSGHTASHYSPAHAFADGCTGTDGLRELLNIVRAATSGRVTASHPNSEVKLPRVSVVLRWGTTREGDMLHVPFFLKHPPSLLPSSKPSQPRLQHLPRRHPNRPPRLHQHHHHLRRRQPSRLGAATLTSTSYLSIIKNFLGGKPASSGSSQVKSIHKQQTTIRKPIECAPEASRGGREWAEMTEGDPSRDDLT